ncbi:hypothetical protein LHU53_00445 [Rhodoferax sp. U2-2l]|uniref:hypothetical protein n=1 Tax=Rhodoferax sp. U2-2l TaxID=2884000 RepID=UPI001D0BE11A|nr:hypothetical protein [Rhodoferax sp. U2-2l]MCB8745374.1 hypothetical protein [Rhodoferax sp. U2-2l]
MLTSVALVMLTAGCASSVGQGGSATVNPAAAPALPASSVLCQPTPPVAHTAPQASEPVLSLLVYAERVRRMQPAEWSQEVTRLGDAASPTDQVQLALVLSQFRQLPEFQRAQDLLGRVLANPSEQALHPLVGQLAYRLGEQRRLEDLLDKQNQQTRELQRRLDQTTDRLEALKAIERSLTSRPPQTPASNSRGSHTPAP